MSEGLKNKVIVITRGNEQAEEPIKKLESLGAKVIPFPTIEIKPLQVFNLFDTYTKNLEVYDYIIFTSENSVSFSIERLQERKQTLPDNLKIVCVGEKSAKKCAEFGVNVDIIPDDYSAKGLLEYFSNKDLKEKNIFIPSSAIARAELKTGLIKLGAVVVQTPIYDVGLPDEETLKENIKVFNTHKPDLFVFTSPSTFYNFIEILEVDKPKDYFNEYSIAVIGETTASAIKETGVHVDIMPKKYTMDNLIDSIIDFYSKK